MKRIRMETKAILNDSTKIAKRQAWFGTLQNLFDGKADAYLQQHVMTVMGILGRDENAQLPYLDPEASAVADLESLAQQLCACEDQNDHFAPPCVEYPIYGVHFIDKMLGADVFFQDGQWNAKYLSTPIGALSMPDLEQDETWQKAKQYTQCFLAQEVALPLLGLPTLSSALNIAVNLYGQDALIALLTEPEAIAHDLHIINELICTLHRWYLAAIPLEQLQPVISWCRTQPPGYGQLCGCTTQLISSGAYQELLMPLDEQLLSLYPKGGMIHLCGSHTQHIEAFRAMPHLKALQLNDRAAEDLNFYVKGLREDQILYVNPCAGMSVSQMLEVTDGKRLVICENIAAPKKPQHRYECGCNSKEYNVK